MAGTSLDGTSLWVDCTFASSSLVQMNVLVVGSLCVIFNKIL